VYIQKDDAIKLIDKVRISSIENLIEKINFMKTLLQADDWSMIIKSHALIETLVTELIISQIDEEKLKSLIERLPLSDEQVGKLKITKDYNLLTQEQRKFIKRFSELRNMIVHKFENINFNLDEYSKSLEKNQKKSWLNIITWYANDDIKNKEDWKKISDDNPSVGVWFSVVQLVSEITLKSEELKGHTNIQKQADKTIKELLSNHTLEDK